VKAVLREAVPVKRKDGSIAMKLQGKIVGFDPEAQELIENNSAFGKFADYVGIKKEKRLICNKNGDACSTCRNCFKAVKGGVAASGAMLKKYGAAESKVDLRSIAKLNTKKNK
jgi:hypothetical protein